MTVGATGGGLAAEGEDIEVLEWPLTRALQAIRGWRDHGC
ncbi:MutT-like protein [Klebsiella pneumoniae subsp. rhinoscleromatis]|nr:MutT-like protein [Klebsiella pneumoniae subsp. rhinoscleromatis]